VFRVNYLAVAMAVATACLSAQLAAEPFAYISNQLADSVSVIDTETGAVVDTIAVAGKPAGVAVASGSNRIYVSAPEAKGFAVLDAVDRRVISKRKKRN
jgi:YVTN family beta-propeller protein